MKYINKIWPIFLMLLLWEIFGRYDPDSVFYFGIPSEIIRYLIAGIFSGSLINDFFITFLEVYIGFLLGNLLGAVLGLLLWHSNYISSIAQTYILILGSIPVFALAPIMIIWFGTGFLMKVMIVFLSTFFVALYHSFKGTKAIHNDDLTLMRNLGSSKDQIFKLCIIPSSAEWIKAGMKINVGYALFGAFIGEYISSNSGLGHWIMIASGHLNISKVYVGVALLLLIGLILHITIITMERYFYFKIRNNNHVLN